MSNPRHIEGLWWFPTDPEKRWFGTLTLDLGATAHLALKSTDGLAEAGTMLQPPVIHGETNAGPVTLLYPFRTGGLFRGVTSTINYSAGFSILGLHLAAAEEFKVNKFSLNIQHLLEWIGHCGFVEHSFGGGEVLIRYQTPECITTPLNPDTRMTLASFASSSSSARERRINEASIWRFESRAGLSFERCRELESAARHLVHFAILKPIYSCELLAYKDGLGHQLGDVFIDREIQVWHGAMRADDSPEVIPGSWVFKLKDLGPNFGVAFDRWLEFCDKFDEPLGCYLGTVYHQLPDTIAFLSMAQCLEAYYSIRHQAHDDQFGDKIEAVLTPIVSLFPGRIPDLNTFAKAVKKTRNYYTHHNPKQLQDGLVARKAELVRMTEVLRVAFQVAVLTELGIPSSHFSRLLNQLYTDLVFYE